MSSIKALNRIHYIKNRVPKNNERYVEPGLAKGSIFLAVKPKKWIINLKNKEKFELWHSMKKNKVKLSYYVKNNYYDIKSIYDQDAISNFLDHTDGNISNMNPNDFIFNFVHEGDFVYIDTNYTDISIDALYYLIEKNVKIMIIHDKTTTFENDSHMFKNFVSSPITFNEDSIMTKNF